MNSLKFAVPRIVKNFANIRRNAIVRNRCMKHTTNEQNTQKGKQSTINDNDIKFFGNLSKNWWDLNGEMKPLHSMNRVRAQFIRDGLANIGFTETKPSQPLGGVKLADIGCGGGILSEALARIGANVTAIDAAPELINVAKNHAASDNSISKNLTYVCTTVEDLCKTSEKEYDAVVASEVIEHVDNQKLFLGCCTKLLKPGGSLFITTFNKTYLSWLSGIIAAEYLLGILPKGTHDWTRFISPTEVQRILETYNCKTRLIHGIIYNPLTNEWSWTPLTSISYALHAVKQE